MQKESALMIQATWESTTSPAAPLHINQESNAISGTNVDVSNLGLKIINPQNDNDEAVGMGFALSTASSNIGAAIIHQRDDVQSRGSLSFATKGVLGEGADIPIRMTIDSNGNVGIGTTPAAWKTSGAEKVLQIDTASLYNNSDNNVYLNSNWFLNSSGQNVYIESDFATSFAQVAGNHIWYGAASGTAGNTATLSERMRIDTSGNVGIGTSSPARELHIHDPSSDNVYLMLSNTTSGAASGDGFQLFTDGTNAGVLNRENGYLKFTTNNQDRMTISNAGNVGIGTSSVVSALDVLNGGNTYTSGLVLRNGSSTSEATSLYHDNTGSTTTVLANRYGSDSAAIKLVLQDASVSPVTALTALGNGNVGIATTSPATKLHVTGTVGAFHSNNDNRILMSNNGTVGSINVTYGTIGPYLPLTFLTGDTERMRLDIAGNVLFGCTALPSGGAGGAAFETGQSSGRSILQLGTTSTSALRVTNFYNGNGNVGNITLSGSATAYNTSSDARLKDVTGKARGLEVINELNPVAYNWKADGKADEGLIAQEVLDIVPNAVSGSEEEMYQMDYSKLVVHLVAGMKEQQDTITELTARLEALENA